MADPVIQPGKRLSYTKRPFLGKSHVNDVIATTNAVNNMQVRVVSTVGLSSGGTPSALNNITPSFVYDANGNGVLTVPIPSVTQNGTNPPGWFWTNGARNYDPSATYDDQQVVYVQSTSAAVTTGLLDAGSGIVEKSIPGLWVALQPVAPQTGPSYYVPRLPMPTPDDMDAENNYWAFLSPMDTCV
jgi:hypothetical protein